MSQDGVTIKSVLRPTHATCKTFTHKEWGGGQTGGLVLRLGRTSKIDDNLNVIKFTKLTDCAFRHSGK